MALLTVSQLIKTVTRDEALDTLIELLQGFGFESTSWQSGSIQRSLVEMAAEVWSEVSGTVAFIARGGFNQLASGEALTQFSDSAYDNQRIAASATQGEMVLTENDGGGPYIIAVGEVVAVDSTTSQTYRNDTGGTINPSPAPGLTLNFSAEVGGTDGNIPPLSDLSLQSTIAGVEITNPAIGTTGTWITAYGIDEESDATLRQRNRSKWPSQSQARPEDALVFLALEAVDANGGPVGITKVFVDSSNPNGEGSVDIYVANDETTATAQQVSDVNVYMQARRSTSSVLRTFAAPTVNQSVEGTAYFTAGSDESVVGAAVQEAVAALIIALDIEGAQYAPFSTGLALNELRGAIVNVTNVLNVTLTVPAADVSMAGSKSLLVLAAPVWDASGTGTLEFIGI